MLNDVIVVANKFLNMTKETSCEKFTSIYAFTQNFACYIVYSFWILLLDKRRK